MRASFPLIATAALLGSQVALAAPAPADSHVAAVTQRAAMKLPAKGGGTGRLRLSVTGSPRAAITVKSNAVQRSVHDDATLRLPVGTYRVRATDISVGSTDYSPVRRKWRVAVKRGSTMLVSVSYDKSGSSSGGSFDTPQNPPTGDMAQLFELVNQARGSSRTCGAKTMPATDPVAWDSDLADAARLHAQDMADKNYFEHDSLDGRSFVDRVEATGYVGYPGGENIAMGFQSAQAVMQGWLNSPGHCQNLMDPDFVDMGLGFASRTDAGYTLPTTYWVQDFGYGQ